MKKILTIFLFLFMTLFLSACEQEGKINISDCREKIEVGENDFSNLFRTYTCDNYKTKDGYIISGKCSYVELNNGKCLKSYTYDKSSNYSCVENEYLTYNGCICQSGTVNINGKCINLKCDGEGEYKNSNNYCECKKGYNKTNLGNGKINCKITLKQKIINLLPKGSFLRGLKKFSGSNNLYVGLYIEKGYYYNIPNIIDEDKPLNYSFNKTDGYGIIGKYHIFVYKDGKIIEERIIPDIYWGKDYLLDWSGKNINLFSYTNTKINNSCYYGEEKPDNNEYYKIEINNLLNFVDIDNDGNKNEIQLIGTQVGTGHSPIATKVIYFKNGKIKEIKDGSISPCYY